MEAHLRGLQQLRMNSPPFEGAASNGPRRLLPTIRLLFLRRRRGRQPFRNLVHIIGCAVDPLKMRRAFAIVGVVLHGQIHRTVSFRAVHRRYYTKILQ